MANVPSFFLTPVFWALLSIAFSFGLTWLLLHRPRKWWVLLAAGIAAFILFGLFGFSGFLTALGLKLWQHRNLAPEPFEQPASAQAHGRKKRRPKPK